MTTIATVLIAIASVIGISLVLTQSGWLNQNPPDSTTDAGSKGESVKLGPVNDTTTRNGTVVTPNGTETVNNNGTETVNNNGTETVNEKQVLYSNVSAIIGIETKTLEANVTKRLSENATHWITGTISLDDEMMDADDDKYLNIKISGWYKFKHGSDWIIICEEWVGTSPFGEKLTIDLPEPNGNESSEDADDLGCDFKNPYSKIKVELDNSRSAHEKRVTLDLFVFSSTVVTATNEG
jgi:hypothetical protein